MLSEAQDSKYWREWGYAVRANEWRMAGGALHPRARLEDSEVHQRVAAFARLIAGKNGRQVSDGAPVIKVNDLRHGCHWLAIGKDKSHAKFTNGDFDRVLQVFRLLVNPLNLQARMDHDAYQRGEDPGERRRHLNGINQVPLAYVRHIIEDQIAYYGESDFNGFPLEKLRSLTRTLKNRKAEWRRPARETVPAEASDNYPF